MAATVISHHKRARKHRGGWSWLARRFGALAVAVAALAFASWIAPRLAPTTPRSAATTHAATQSPAVASAPATITLPDEAAELAPAPRRAPRQVTTRPSISLDASFEHLGQGYEILTAGEMSAISQAHEADARSQFARPVQAATTRAESDYAREAADGEDQGGQSGRRTRRR